MTTWQEAYEKYKQEKHEAEDRKDFIDERNAILIRQLDEAFKKCELEKRAS